MNKIRERSVHFDKTYGGRRGYGGHEVTRATRGHAQGRVGLKHRGPVLDTRDHTWGIQGICQFI